VALREARMPESKTADAVKLVLRLPKSLHKRLRHQAARNNVSLNTEIVTQLEGAEAAAEKRMLTVLEKSILTVLAVRPQLIDSLRVTRPQDAEESISSVSKDLEKLRRDFEVAQAKLTAAMELRLQQLTQKSGAA
jgi:hypothetical protein